MGLIVTFDGPKGVGKSTMLERVRERLAADGLDVAVLVEKEVMSAVKKELGPLYERMRAAPSATIDQAIADTLLAGRVEITSQVKSTPIANTVLLDRWYPSDTVFRRYLSVDALVSANIAAGVLVPDLIVAVLCAPHISWDRAHQRERSLDSKVIYDFEAHAWSTKNFKEAALKFGWMPIESDTRSPDALAIEICNQISLKVEATC